MSADGDIIRNEFKHVGISKPASDALARLEAAAERLGIEEERHEAASEECREWQDAARTWQDNYHAAEAQRDALAEALRLTYAKLSLIVGGLAYDDASTAAVLDALDDLNAICEIARAALAEAGLD